jgi:hypothetical protein
MGWVEVIMDGKKYKALTHALHDIGFKPTSGRPYKDEIDAVWRNARAQLKKDGSCSVIRNGKEHKIQLCNKK